MKILFYLLALLCSVPLYAQDNLLNELEDNASGPQYTIATFKGTRVVNGQSIETKRRGELEFIFSHRFGLINEGAYALWGLDQSVTRLGLEYGITDRFGLGIGRTSVDKTFDGYFRYKALRQSDKFPVTVTALGSVYYKTYPRNSESPVPLSTEDRLAYGAQVLIARKFSPKLSLQLNPIYIHRNTVDQDVENNDDLALGFAGRYKITRSVALSGEYFLRLNAKENQPPDYVRYDAVGIGIDIETGGHVFQLVFTNTLGMFERYTITETYENFWDGDIHFGFNITRTFQLGVKR
ncbi:MAG: DUF5777 family beta-barrel protein [Cyclobacteriaceae bacterium]|nr:DUF5777 family beta-barrel protein [Cyclobacteriaceae bacterium]